MPRQPRQIRQQQQIMLRRFSKPDARIQNNRLPLHPPRRRRPRRANKYASTSPTTSTYLGASCIIAGRPCRCISTIPAPCSATSENMATPPSVPADVSFTGAAPASSAAFAASASVVSMLTITPRRLNSRTTASVRAICSPAGTLTAPGRVDSPPTSITSAPSSTISIPRADRLRCIQKLSAVGKTVRGDVQHAHHHRPVQPQLPSPRQTQHSLVLYVHVI